jgi:hypothetical protein
VTPPPASEPARKEPAPAADADALALIKAKGPAPDPPRASSVSLHVSPAAVLVNVISGPDSNLGSAEAMENEWRDADAHEVTSYHKAKLERADMARLLEVAQGESSFMHAYALAVLLLLMACFLPPCSCCRSRSLAGGGSACRACAVRREQEGGQR